MIPLVLRIQNFLSYGSIPQVIDFRPYKLICLSGKNGHGKSALLDAITWALWGSARKTNGTSKADQGVLKLGHTEMMVSLDFISNGNTYRIRRVFSTKYGKPSAHVDFGTYNPENDIFIPLTEKTIRRTQEVINQVLGLDYDGFINSSFIRQGQSNEFSKKSPKDRKEILATILGLNKYEKARKLASDESKRLLNESEYAKKFAHHINQACLAIESEEAKLKTVEMLFQEFEIQKNSILRLKKATLEEKETLQIKYQEYALIEADLKRNILDTTSMTDRFFVLVNQWKKNHTQFLKLSDKDEIKKKKEILKEKINKEIKSTEKKLTLRTQLIAYQEKEQKLITHINKEHQTVIHTKSIDLEKCKLEINAYNQEEKNIQQEIDELLIQKNALDNKVTALQKEVPPQLLINDTQELQKLFERYKFFYQKWIDAGNIINNELKHIYEKKKLIDDINNPSCPLCEQNVSQARKRFLLGKLSTQDQFLLHRFTKLKKLINWIKEVITTQHKALEVSKKIDLLLQDEASKATAIQTKKEKIISLQFLVNEKKAILEKKIEELSILQKNAAYALENNSEYKDIQLLKKNITSELENCMTDEKLQSSLQKELILLEEQEQQWLIITEQKALQVERRAMISELCIAIKKKKKECNTQKQKLAEHELITKKHAELNIAEKKHNEDLIIIENKTSELIKEKGCLEGSLKKLYEQQKEYVLYEKKSHDLLLASQEYSEVATAYGKDGLQALLIEDALPEIEQEANDLLSKLTDNQTHLFIESLRDLKKGGTKETLDINISDNNGIRPYEMFSGGEAFRIDFALRIAISKLLARRAGTSLQTLIIDEGFGSQDEEGLSRIMDVIYKIQDDFEKVIIVSHLTTMKDQFPVHFIIEKENQGSKVHIRELA